MRRLSRLGWLRAILLSPLVALPGYWRGGTTVGAVYLTCDRVAPDVLEHEAVHRAQWRKYRLALIPLYLAAGRDGRTNRFEIEASLGKGGYQR